jgi:hypothetical protein
MNILVLNGSPKGDYSITLQTVLYLQKKFPEDSFRILNVGQKSKALERSLETAIPDTVYDRLCKELEVGANG